MEPLDPPGLSVDPAELSLDPLTERRRVWQRRRGHRSATDDFLAAWSALEAAPDAGRVLDLGCGHGTVTLLLSQVLDARFDLVEAQAVSAELARRNLATNGLAARASVQRLDLRELDPEPTYDLVTGTPPFMPLGSGILPKDPQRAAGRFELRGGIEAYLACAARALAPEGRVSMLMDGAQDVRVRAAFAAVGLHVHVVLAVRPRAAKEVRFRGYIGGAGARPLERRELVVRESDGAYTPAMRAVRSRFEAYGA